jgi:hypothetical protein
VSYAKSADGLNRMVGRAMEMRLFDHPSAATAYFLSLIGQFSDNEIQAEAAFLGSMVNST